MMPGMSVSMTNLDIAKKPASQDWHPADIVAAVRKAGWSLRRLSIRHDYHPQSLQRALQTPWPRAELIIARAIGFRPQSIWPSRYHRDGRPKSGRGERGIGRYKKNSRKRLASNGYVRGERGHGRAP